MSGEAAAELLAHDPANRAVQAMVHEIRGSFDEAERCTRSPDWPRSSDYREHFELDPQKHRARIGLAVARAGAVEVALRVLDDPGLNKYDRAKILAPLIEDAIARPDLTGAVALLERLGSLQDARYRYWALRASLCRQAVRSGNQELAEQLIDRKPGEFDCDDVVVAFAVEMAALETDRGHPGRRSPDRSLRTRRPGGAARRRDRPHSRVTPPRTAKPVSSARCWKSLRDQRTTYGVL